MKIEKPKWCGRKVSVLIRYVRRYAKTADPTVEFVAACLDKHVPGKHDGKSLEDFLAAGAKLENKSDVTDFVPPVQSKGEMND